MKEAKGYYRWPAEYVTPTAAMGPLLRQRRKEAILAQEMFRGFQKSAGAAGDREGEKFFKECLRENLRLQHAITLTIPWVAEPDKGQKETRPRLWPVEMQAELDRVAGWLVLL